MPECISKGVEVVVLWDIAAIDIQHGVARLHLLTTAVAGFFERQGYLLARNFRNTQLHSDKYCNTKALSWSHIA